MLSKFSIRKCVQVTDVGIIAIANCHHLRMVMLNDTQVSDAGIYSLVAGCHGLRDLFACGTRVTVAGVAALSRLELLEDAWFKRNNIDPTEPVLGELRRLRPRAKIKVI